MQRNIETFIGCDAEYADARIVLFGAPFDSTTSYRPGARFGPSAARHESYGLETFSPYLFRDMSECAVFDAGDIELPMGSSVMALEAISEQTAQILSDGKVPFMVGGEHLVTLGAFRQVAARYPDIHIIHLDAHADLRQDYLGVELSHATVMRRCYDIVGEGRIHQYGIRSGEKAEFCFSRDGVYCDVVGLCKVAKLDGEDGIIDQDYSLNAGRYVGVVIEDDGLTAEEFKAEMLALNEELHTLNEASSKLQDTITKNLNFLLEKK